MKNEIDYKSKKFSNDLIDELNLKFELAYGRINYVKKSLIFGNSFKCPKYEFLRGVSFTIF